MDKYALSITLVALAGVFGADAYLTREQLVQARGEALQLRYAVADLEARLSGYGQEQERLGQVLVMLSNGWYAWPTVPACEHQGRVILNVPCHELGFVIGEGHPLTTPPDAIDPGEDGLRTKWEM